MTSSSFQIDDATLEVRYLTSRIARVTLTLPGDQPAGLKVALPVSDPGLAPDQCDFSIDLEPEPLRLEFRDREGNVLLRGTDHSCLSWDAGRSRVRFRRATEEHYYGLGQWGPGFDKDGATRRLWNSHFGYGPGTDMAVPFVISSRGYGLFFDNSWDAELALGRNDTTNTLAYTAEGGQLDFYFLSGPDPKAILAEYARLTGYPPLPPRWALGYIQSTRHFEDPEEIVDLARTLRDKHIPCDAIVFLSSYGDEMGMNNGVGTLEFHPRLWSDPGRLLAELKARHFRVVSHEYPVVSPRSEHFEEAVRRGYLLDYAGSESSVMFNEGQRYLDFSRPEVGEWWWEAHSGLVDSGVDGWWLDGGEGPAADVQLHDGSGRALHNAFDFYRQQAFADGERRSRPDSRPWLLCRSGYAGMQRFGSASWSGDINNTFDVFEAQLALGLSTAMSGVPYWGTDIGGFFHTVPESPELFVRWYQFAAFCPLFRSHGRGIGRRGWREHLPWAHGPEIEAICRAFGELRYRLFPYNYSLAWEAHMHGTPLMRPMLLEFADDPNVVAMSAQYMWGPSLLVAPVTRGGARHWPVYLPRGTWYDFWTHDKYSGEQWVEVPAPLDRLPLFVRGGALIPLGPSKQYLDAPGDSVSLLVYPDAESTFTLYEDDGVSRKYEHGSYALTEVRCTASDGGISLRVDSPKSRTMDVRLYSPPPPTLVILEDGAPLSWVRDGERFVSFSLTLPSAAVSLRSG